MQDSAAVQDSQDWWYKDEPELYTDWNGMEVPSGQDGAGLMAAMERVVGQGGYAPGAGAGAPQPVYAAGAGYGMNGASGGFGPRDTGL